MPRHPMVSHINRAFEKSYRGWRKPRSIGLRLVGNCMKKTILDMRATGPAEEIDAAGMYNMSYGNAYEEWFGNRLKSADLLKHGGVLREDMQINVAVPQYQGNGYMDFLVHFEGKDIAVEVKSCNQRKFDLVLKTSAPSDQDHYYQLQIYMHFLGLKTGWLVYIDRDKHWEDIDGEVTPRWEILEYKYDAELGETLEKRLKKLKKYLDNGKTPKKEPTTSQDPRCTWCNHRKECWGESAPRGTVRAAANTARTASNSQTRRGRNKSFFNRD